MHNIPFKVIAGQQFGLDLYVWVDSLYSGITVRLTHSLPMDAAGQQFQPAYFPSNDIADNSRLSQHAYLFAKDIITTG